MRTRLYRPIRKFFSATWGWRLGNREHVRKTSTLTNCFEINKNSLLRLLSRADPFMPTNVPRSRHQVLLQSEHLVTTGWVKSSTSSSSDSGSSTFNRRKAWTTSCSMWRHQRWVDANESIPRERPQSGFKAGNCDGELAEHNSASKTKLLRDHKPARQSRPLLLIQALLQVRRRHRRDLGFLLPYYKMRPVISDTAMWRNSRE